MWGGLKKIKKKSRLNRIGEGNEFMAQRTEQLEFISYSSRWVGNPREYSGASRRRSWSGLLPLHPFVSRLARVLFIHVFARFPRSAKIQTQ